MAMVEYGGGIAAFWGSIGGTTFSRAGSMNIAKRRAYPRNRLIPARQITRGYFSRCIERWKVNLSNQDRIDWQDAAANFSQSRHGIAYTITGMNLFIAFNTLHLFVTDDFLDAPLIFTGRLAQRTVTYAWNAATHKVRINFTPALEASEILLLWWTNADRKFATYRKIAYRHDAFLDNGAGLPFDIDAQYRTADGTLHFHFIVLDYRGAISSGWDTYYQYTYA